MRLVKHELSKMTVEESADLLLLSRREVCEGEANVFLYHLTAVLKEMIEQPVEGRD